MSWAKVKKINSDMSKPLDELIRGEKVFVGGTSAIAPAYVNSKYYTFTPKLDGVVSIKVSGKNSSDVGQSVGVNVYENSNEVISKTLSFPPLTYENLYGLSEFLFEVPIKKGNTYKIHLGSNSWITLDDIYFYGQVTDYNYFETAVIE